MTDRRSRWGDTAPSAPSSNAAAEDELALAALLNDANARSEVQGRDDTKRPGRPHQRQDMNGRGGRGGGGRDKPIVEDDVPNRRKRRRWNDRQEDEGGEERWGQSKEGGGDLEGVEPEKNPNRVKPEFGLSGALATDSNTGNVYNGVTLKFSEPPEARIPNTRWRLYVFRKKTKDAPTNDTGKGDDLIDTYHISQQSAYLFGRERKVADIPVDHPSLSKQHAVLQYRALPSNKQQIGEPDKLQCRPYLMDLESTNGTFINGVRLDSARYYELRRGDVITLGASSREYVLLTEQSAKKGI